MSHRLLSAVTGGEGSGSAFDSSGGGSSSDNAAMPLSSRGNATRSQACASQLLEPAEPYPPTLPCSVAHQGIEGTRAGPAKGVS